MNKISNSTGQTLTKPGRTLDYTGAAIFVVPSLKKARAALPDRSEESWVLARMISGLNQKEKGTYQGDLLRMERFVPTRKIDPEEYKDMSQWVVPLLNEAIGDLPVRSPERIVLTGMIKSLEQKEKAFLESVPRELDEAVLI